MASNDDLIRTLVAAHPELMELTHRATAGQKKVFRAIRKGEALAIKAVLIGDATDPVQAPEDPDNAEQITGVAARLQREVAILTKCNSDNIVRLTEPRLEELRVGNEIYVVYAEQWVDGEDLSVLFRQRRLARAEAIDLGLALCNALQELDTHGYVHRDVKPANVMRRIDGTFVLVDPGLALDRSGPSLSMAGAVVGTAAYLSPEQWDVGRKRDLDIRSDMFAVGTVMFEGLMGRHPFYDPGMSHLDIMTITRSKAPRELDREDIVEDDPLRQILARLMAKNPHGRYRDATALRKALEAAR